MNGMHDLGGRDGFGPVQRETDEPVFHAPWEGRVLAGMGLLLGAGWFNVDAFRHGIERLAPERYLRASYYERWLASVCDLLDRAGLVTRSELLARERSGPEDRPAAPTSLSPPLAGAAPGFLRPGAAEPRFAAGDRVRARNHQPRGHTRLPGYARGRRGEVVRVHPPCVFPDANAHGLGERPECVYNVRFAADELFGDAAEPNAGVHLDLFESYLEPA